MAQQGTASAEKCVRKRRPVGGACLDASFGVADPALRGGLGASRAYTAARGGTDRGQKEDRRVSSGGGARVLQGM
jgi:hypothetical protein